MVSHKPSEHCYGTMREIDFVRRLGSHTRTGTEKTRLELLESYYATALTRHWDKGVNREKILAAVVEEIELEKRGR